MSGNATEEWLLTRLDYPGHMDPSRLAGLSGGAVGIAVGLLLNLAIPAPMATVVGFFAAFGFGAVVYRAFDRRDRERQVARLKQARQRAEETTQAAILQMNMDEASVARAMEAGKEA